MAHKRALIATLVAGVFAITAGAVVITRAAGGGSSSPPACPPHPHDAACVFLGMPTEYISRLPAAKQTWAARILQDYENAVRTPQQHLTVPRAWLTPGTATPTPLVAGPSIRPCHASDLRAGWLGENGAGGRISASIGLGNASSTPCGLSLPTVRLVDASGKVVLRLPGGRGTCTSGPIGPCIFPQPLLMAPGLAVVRPHALLAGQASLAIIWWPGDGAGSCTPPPVVARIVRLVLPAGGGNLDVSAAPEFPRGIVVCHGQAGIFAFTGKP